MSTTLTQFAYQALRDIGCLRPGQTTSADVLNDIKDAAQQMIDAWLIDRMLVYTVDITTYNLQAGTQTYSIGPNVSGLGFRSPRPTHINFANVILNTVNPVVRQPLEILRDDKEWGRIRVQQIPFAIPLKLYYDGSYAPASLAANIYLWPGPQANYGLELFTWKQLQNFADLTTPYDFPPAYARMIRKCLGVEIAPMMRMYAKVPGPGGLRSYDPMMLARVETQARQARQEVESYNAPQPAVVVDQAFAGASRRGAFNYGTGDIGGPR